MNITLKVFASIRDICGFDEKKMQVPVDTTIEQFVELLICEHGQLQSKRGSLLIAVNEEYTAPSRVLSDGDVVALFPPVSGG